MNTENLKVNEIYKNYKAICEVLGEKQKTGNGKKAQLKEWERYFKYRKEGYKFIIEKIYTTPKSKHSKTLSYIENIEKLVLDLLAQSDNDEVYLSKHQMFKTLRMVNNNYAQCKIRPLKLSAFIDVDENIINEWYDSTDSLLVRNLEKALNSLRKRSLIVWCSDMTVCKLETNKNRLKITAETNKDIYGEDTTEYKLFANQSHRPATKQEKRKILKIERETLKCLGCDNKQQAILLGQWKTFQEVVKEEILNELNIAYYYNSYNVIFNPEHVKEALNDIMLKDIQRKEIQEELNQGVINRVETNTHKRKLKAEKECRTALGLVKNKKMSIRLKKDYEDQCNKLNNHLLDIKAESIVREVKETKLE